MLKVFSSSLDWRLGSCVSTPSVVAVLPDDLAKEALGLLALHALPNL